MGRSLSCRAPVAALLWPVGPVPVWMGWGGRGSSPASLWSCSLVKQSPAWLKFGCAYASGTCCAGFPFDRRPPRSLFLPKELKIAHPLSEHPLLRGQAVGSCVYCTFRSPFSFDLHLVSRANPEKCCVSSSLADVCDFI